MKRTLLTAILLIASWMVLGSGASTAHACPMCQTANESKKDNVLPRAYMYSILFMLAVPATIATGFSVGFYRLSKKRQPPVLPGEETDPHGHHLGPQ